MDEKMTTRDKLFYTYHFADRPPDCEEEAIERMTKYMEHFVKIYGYSEH